jgi:hypothetical protein
MDPQSARDRRGAHRLADIDRLAQHLTHRPSSPAQHRIQQDLLPHNLTFRARGALKTQA